MKKLLTILGSLGVAATAAAGVVACGTQADDKELTPDAQGMIKATAKVTLTSKQSAEDAVKPFSVYSKFDATKADDAQANVKASDAQIALSDADKAKFDAAKDAKDVEVTLNVSFKAPDAIVGKKQEFTYTLAKSETKDSKTTLTSISTIKFNVPAKAAPKATLAEKATTTDQTVFTIATTNIADAEDVKANVTVAGLPSGTKVASAAVKTNVLTITLNKAIAQTDKEQSFKVTYKNGDQTLTSSLVVTANAPKTEDNSKIKATKAELKDKTLTITLSDKLVKAVTVADIKAGDNALTDSSATGLEAGSNSIVVTLSDTDAANFTVDAKLTINGLDATAVTITAPQA